MEFLDGTNLFSIYKSRAGGGNEAAQIWEIEFQLFLAVFLSASALKDFREHLR